MAAAGIAVSVSMGVLKPLLEKLATLLGDKYKKFKRVRDEVSFLVKELGEMKALLEDMDNTEDELNMQAKKWRKDIIDMSYDIEDCIDNFMDRVGDTDDKVGILKKASHYLRTIKYRYCISNQINDIKTRVIEASKRRDRYNLNVCTSSSTTKVAVDPRLTALYKDSATLVGIDTQKKELVKWVDDEDKQLKVKSIVGFGGLGKTTLANEVYREVKGHFNSNAFVPVSQKPNIPRLLSSMCSKHGLPPYSDGCEVHELIDTLREYLDDKRYFIVLDDLWNVKDWNIISCAFSQNNQQSRLIVTTRIEGVAQACCVNNGCIHYMKPLSDADSRKLFFRGTEDICPPQLSEVSSEILKKCGGLPLAIVTMDSTLADQPKQHWDSIQRSIVIESAANSLDDMMQILDLSYKHLPHHLRACFLYLGIYPEDYEIERDQVIGLWVAESIVIGKSPGQDVKDVAESYFNELVNRNMIQLVRKSMSQPESYHYRVHDMMLHLIMKRCREDNFVSVVHGAQVLVEQQGRVHRLSVSLSGDAEDDTILQVATNCCRSPVRSLVLFATSKWIPPFSDLKSLRVLHLKFRGLMGIMDLTAVGQLSQLRYLKVDDAEAWRPPNFSERFVVLPGEIWRLRHLAKLEICSIPVCISPLSGSMSEKSLRTLRPFVLAGRMSENGLGELNKLLVPNFDFCRNDYVPRPRVTDDDTPKTIWMDARFFLTSHSIAIGADAPSSLSPPLHDLQELYICRLIFSPVPRWIGGLQKLRKLQISATQMDIDIIGALPCLIELLLRIIGKPTGRMVIGGTTGFNALVRVDFYCDAASYLTFEDGAMPSLQVIGFKLDWYKWDKATLVGLQYLSSLKWLQVVTLDRSSDSVTSSEMYKVFRDAVNAHPNRLTFNFSH